MSLALVTSTMDKVSSDLRSRYLVAQVKVNTTFYADESAALAAKGALAQAGRRIDRLEKGGDLYASVVSGGITFAKWSEIATITHGEISGVTADIREWSMLGVLSDTISKTAGDIVQGAKDLPKESLPYLTLGVIALIAVIVLKVL